MKNHGLSRTFGLLVRNWRKLANLRNWKIVRSPAKTVQLARGFLVSHLLFALLLILFNGGTDGIVGAGWEDQLFAMIVLVGLIASGVQKLQLQLTLEVRMD